MRAGGRTLKDSYDYPTFHEIVKLGGYRFHETVIY